MAPGVQRVRPSHHAQLGVSRAATAAEIRQAFLEKARIWHPDKCAAPDAAERFRLVREAFEALSGPSVQCTPKKKPRRNRGVRRGPAVRSPAAPLSVPRARPTPGSPSSRFSSPDIPSSRSRESSGKKPAVPHLQRLRRCSSASTCTSTPVSEQMLHRATTKSPSLVCTPPSGAQPSLTRNFLEGLVSGQWMPSVQHNTLRVDLFGGLFGKMRDPEGSEHLPREVAPASVPAPTSVSSATASGSTDAECSPLPSRSSTTDSKENSKRLSTSSQDGKKLGSPVASLESMSQNFGSKRRKTLSSADQQRCWQPSLDGTDSHAASSRSTGSPLHRPRPQQSNQGSVPSWSYDSPVRSDQGQSVGRRRSRAQDCVWSEENEMSVFVERRVEQLQRRLEDWRLRHGSKGVDHVLPALRELEALDANIPLDARVLRVTSISAELDHSWWRRESCPMVAEIVTRLTQKWVVRRIGRRRAVNVDI
mmetsp:Transcript_43299/g.113931  ORF Transcript_43299/g.113931 Transcript_43299/m.113931 type:complete len:477 (-) Transcript_43299:166-1596(-)